MPMDSIEEYSTHLKTWKNVQLEVAGYQETGIQYLKLSLVQYRGVLKDWPNHKFMREFFLWLQDFSEI